jgi:hypothetical protein
MRAGEAVLGPQLEGLVHQGEHLDELLGWIVLRHVEPSSAFVWCLSDASLLEEVLLDVDSEVRHPVQLLSGGVPCSCSAELCGISKEKLLLRCFSVKLLNARVLAAEGGCMD